MIECLNTFTQSVKNILNLFINTNNLKDLYERNKLYNSIFNYSNEIFSNMYNENSNEQTYLSIINISNELLNKKQELSIELYNCIFNLINKQIVKKK